MLHQVHNFIKSSELRQNLAKYLKLSADEPVVVAAGHSAGSRVIVDSELYNRLVETYEDYQDAELLEQLVAADDGERVSWKDVQ